MRETEAWVETDPLLCARIVCNLAENALRYTRHGGVLIGARLRKDVVRVQVWATGPGIPEAERDLVFEEFSRGAAGQRDDASDIALAGATRGATVTASPFPCITNPGDLLYRARDAGMRPAADRLFCGGNIRWLDDASRILHHHRSIQDRPPVG